MSEWDGFDQSGQGPGRELGDFGRADQTPDEAIHTLEELAKTNPAMRQTLEALANKDGAEAQAAQRALERLDEPNDD